MEDSLGNVVEIPKFRNPRVLLGNSSGSLPGKPPPPLPTPHPSLLSTPGGLPKGLGGDGHQREGPFRASSAPAGDSSASKSGEPNDVIDAKIGCEGGATGRKLSQTGQCCGKPHWAGEWQHARGRHTPERPAFSKERAPPGLARSPAALLSRHLSYLK